MNKLTDDNLLHYLRICYSYSRKLDEKISANVLACLADIGNKVKNNERTDSVIIFRLKDIIRSIRSIGATTSEQNEAIAQLERLIKEIRKPGSSYRQRTS